MLGVSAHIPAGYRRVGGFTLIELLVTLTIAAIVLAIGVPNMRSLLEGQRVSTTANGMLAAINLARSEAITRAGRVDLVPADGADWSSGWVVFIDQDSDLVPDAGERIVFSAGPVAAGVKVDSNMPAYLSYQGSGRTRRDDAPQSVLFGTFSITAGEQERRVRINMLGRARVCNPDSKYLPC